MTETIKFTKEHEKEYIELWNKFDPQKNVDKDVHELIDIMNEANSKIKELNNMEGVPLHIYKKYITFLDAETLIQNNIIDIDFVTELMPQIMSMFVNGSETGLNIFYYISEEFSWHDACKFADKAIFMLYQMYNVLRNSPASSEFLKNNLPKAIKAFTTYFPDEIIETQNYEYLVGHPKVLYDMANGIPMKSIHKDAAVECLIIALEAGLPFAKHLVESNFIETK